MQNVLCLVTVFSKCLLNFSEKRHILLGNNWEKENNVALALAVGKTWKQIKKIQIKFEFSSTTGIDEMCAFF